MREFLGRCRAVRGGHLDGLVLDLQASEEGCRCYLDLHCSSGTNRIQTHCCPLLDTIPPALAAVQALT